MTPVMLAWLLSLAGAALFFAAGDVVGRQRKGRSESTGLTTLRAELEATRAHMLEQERAKQELRARETQLNGELAQRRNAFDQLSGELVAKQVQSDALEHDLANVRAELQRARSRSVSPSKLQAPAPAGAGVGAGADKATLDELARLKRDHELATLQLNQIELERTRLQQQLELAKSDTQSASLHQELSLTHESLLARDAQIERLQEEAARTRGIESELERTKRELAELAEQTRSLRAEVYASRRPPTKRPERPATISTRGDALQCIVDDETEHRGASSAVIADELGLVVASSGVVSEYGDALAAFGAYLADLGTKTRDVLPLQEVQQVVVRDDHAMTLIVRPLATEDPGLALVTLGIDMNPAISIQGRPT